MGGVVALQHARGDHGAGAFLQRQGAAQHGLDGLSGHAARAQQARPIGQAGDDGGFHPHFSRAPIKDRFDAPRQIRRHMVGAGGAHPSRAIGRGGRHGLAQGSQQGQGDGVGGHAQPDGVEPRSGQRRDRAGGRHWDNERQRPRPEGLRQSAGLGVEDPFALGRLQVHYMGDERVERGSPLGRVDARHRLATGGVRAQPVDRLGGKGDEPASGEHARGLAQADGR